MDFKRNVKTCNISETSFLSGGRSDLARPKHAGGRPKKDENERRNVAVQIAVTPQEKDEIVRRAKLARLSQGSFLLARALDAIENVDEPNLSVSTDGDENRTVQISIYVTRDERALLRRLAQTSRMSMASFIVRRALL